MFAKTDASDARDGEMPGGADGQSRAQLAILGGPPGAPRGPSTLAAHPWPTVVPGIGISRSPVSSIPGERARSRRANHEGALGPAADAPLRVVVMLDASGCILYQTVNAERLFSLLDGTNDERAPNPGRCWPILDTIRALVRSLVEASKGRATKPRPIVRRTHWGQVIVEASWLAPTSTEAGQFDPLATPIAVHVELCEHAAACAARALRASGATPAQVRVGVLLALGKSKPEIARTLGIKESSVQDAARKLYSKLDVRNATELGVLLWLKTDKDGMAGKA